MRGFLKKEFRNIVFIVLVVAAALTIYLLSRTAEPADASAENSAAAESTPPSETDEPVFSGVPEDVLLTHLLTAEVFSAEPSKDGDRAWLLSVGESPTLEARFSYTVERGAVAGFDLAFVLPAEASKKSGSAIDQYINANSAEIAAAWSGAIRTLLTDLVPACDADDAIAETTVRIWAEKAAALDAAGDSYTGSAGGGSFSAYITQSIDGLTLVCALDAPD